MKIRTLNQLDDCLAEDLAWRRKELTSIANFVRASRDKSQPMAIRAGMVLLYAHWEGFVKWGAECYLNFVSMQGLAFDQLGHSFFALCTRRKLEQFTSSNKSSIRTELISFMRGDLSGRAHVPHKDVIDTESNLSSSVLKEILHAVGLDYSPYALKEKLIDRDLLKARNEIAHGQYLAVDSSKFENLYEEVKNLLILFHNQVSNAATVGSFRRA
ncbi:MAG TPA: MAE_28990/MAE_18760 family HEPN-like nuclease [Gemmataceae bacterium]|jgi:hypothetical protein|nr:MAE_28990/MAE_18760 family HEPN-like nuclease [Gemmataceae bacterium]